MPMKCGRPVDSVHSSLYRRLTRGTLSCPESLALAAVLIIPASIVEAVLSILLGYVPGAELINKASIAAQHNVDIYRVLFVVVVAPLIENVFVALSVFIMLDWRTKWWVKPLLVGFVFALLHAYVHGGIKPLSAMPGFFVMALLIERTERAPWKLCGFFSSIVFHSLNNSFILIPYFLGR